jgi:hypothetical protein
MRLWDDEAEEKLWLLTIEEMANLPVGTRLTSIGGKTTLYDPDNPPDFDTRYGVSAWGLIDGKAEFIP